MYGSPYNAIIEDYIRWVNIRIEMLGGLFATSLAAYLVYGQRVRAADTGFSLTMAGKSLDCACWIDVLLTRVTPVTFSGMILWWVRYFSEFQVQGKPFKTECV